MKLSLWCNGQRIGILDKIQSDQPWLYSNIDYDDPAYGHKLEQITYFVFVVLEEDWGDFEDDASEDREYKRRIESLGLQKEDLDIFQKNHWEIRTKDQKEKVIPHCFQDGLFGWRGPMRLPLQKFEENV